MAKSMEPLSEAQRAAVRDLLGAPRPLRNGRHRRTDDLISVAIIVSVFAVLFVCACIGANR